MTDLTKQEQEIWARFSPRPVGSRYRRHEFESPPDYLNLPQVKEEYKKRDDPEHWKILFRDCCAAFLDGFEHVLDAGCGFGFVSTALSRTVKNVYAIDLSETELRKLENVIETYPRYRNIHVSLADIESLPFPDDFFEGVVVADVLEWVHKRDRAMQEIRRVCKDGALMLFEDEDWESLKWRSELGIEYVDEGPWIIRAGEELSAHYTVRTRKSYRELNYYLCLMKDSPILGPAVKDSGREASLCSEARKLGVSFHAILEATERVEYAHSYGFAGQQMKPFLEGHGCVNVFHLITPDGARLRRQLVRLQRK